MCFRCACWCALLRLVSFLPPDCRSALLQAQPQSSQCQTRSGRGMHASAHSKCAFAGRENAQPQLFPSIVNVKTSHPEATQMHERRSTRGMHGAIPSAFLQAGTRTLPPDAFLQAGKMHSCNRLRLYTGLALGVGSALVGRPRNTSWRFESRTPIRTASSNRHYP